MLARFHSLFCLGALSALSALGCQGDDAGSLCTGKCDIAGGSSLRSLIAEAEVTPLSPPVVGSEEQVELGRLLFFDRELSGNRDIACATCHHPALGSSDGLALSVGVGGDGLGPEREPEEGRSLIPRNSPDLFNRGLDGWTVMFWDGRVAGVPYDLATPAGDALPDSANDPLAAQSMFPPTSADEMRGEPEDGNAVSVLADDDLEGIWKTLTDRIVAIPEYRDRLERAFPADSGPFDFGHISTAIAAFERVAFTSLSSPFDRYLAGDEHALDPLERQGAALFFGKAGCAGCHNGPFLSDQEFHNICAPQIGPGKGDESPQDFGRGRETGDPADRYAFRTPPLRNVALTGPWMHSGAYDDLEDVVRHHLDPVAALQSYAGLHLPPELRDTIVLDDAMLDTLDPLVTNTPELSDAEVAALVAFLHALTDPAALDLDHLVPTSVPSGLPVDR